MAVGAGHGLAGRGYWTEGRALLEVGGIDKRASLRASARKSMEAQVPPLTRSRAHVERDPTPEAFCSAWLLGRSDDTVDVDSCVRTKIEPGAIVSGSQETSRAPHPRIERFGPTLKACARSQSCWLCSTTRASLQSRGATSGVDAFFVISGFVITGLLLRERASRGRTSILHFYGRRCRRIIPAATLVIITTVAISYAFSGAGIGPRTAVDGRWAAVFLANFHFWAVGTNYLSSQQPPSPLQNYWSLSVEEQFYIVYPTLFVLLAGLTRPSHYGHGSRSVLAPSSWRRSPFRSSIRRATPPELTSHPSHELGSWRWEHWSRWGHRGFCSPGAPRGPDHLDGSNRNPGGGSHIRCAHGLSGFSDVNSRRWCGARHSRGDGGPAPRSRSSPRFGSVSRHGKDFLLAVPVALADPHRGRRARRENESFSSGEPRVGRGGTDCVHCLLLPGREPGAPRRSLVAPSPGKHRPRYHTGRRHDRSHRDPVKPERLSGLPVGGRIPATGRRESDWAEAKATPTRSEMFDASWPPPPGSRAMPRNLVPPLSQIESESNLGWPPAKTGCFAIYGESIVPRCAFGDLSGTETMVLYGDSHAAMWFRALNEIAIRSHWKLIVLAKVGCPAGLLATHAPGESGEWVACRPMAPVRRTEDRSDRPESVADLSGDPTEARWRCIYGDTVAPGTERSFSAGSMLQRAKEVIIGNIPHARGPDCLLQHLSDVQACSTVPSRSDLRGL